MTAGWSGLLAVSRPTGRNLLEEDHPMAPTTLVRPLFDGPLDIVGDVHGEIDALRHLLGHLCYGDDGTHPAGRRLVFVGDLIDRGPDSPGVVALVRKLVVAGRAQCVLGNHELNVLREARKKDNHWYFDGLGPAERDTMSRFFQSLPLALERHDLRVAHACWDDAAVAQVRYAEDVMGTHHHFHTAVEADLNERGVTERVERSVALQNGNPVKRITSGLERRADPPVEVNGELREAERVPWWSEYEGPLAVFGHYWRVKLVGDPDHGHLFDDRHPHALLGRGRAMCIDYSLGKRPKERRGKPTGFGGPFTSRLAALQHPEMVLMFDNGKSVAVVPPVW